MATSLTAILRASVKLSLNRALASAAAPRTRMFVRYASNTSSQQTAAVSPKRKSSFSAQDVPFAAGALPGLI